MLRFDERVHLPKNRENTITFLVNGEPIGTVETLAPGAKTVNIPVPSVDYDSVIDALGYVPYDSSNPNGYITSSALGSYVTTNTNQIITAGKSFHNAELLTDNFITLNGTTAYLRGQSGINYYNLMNLNNSGITVGSVNQPIKIAGNTTRPQYNSNDLALYSDIPTITVDQVYDATSANAQSGIAIANAGFLTGITNSDVTNALGYTPVDKAGDTMTGILTVEKSSENYPIKLQANDITHNVIPSADTYCGLSIVDSNGDLLGYIMNDAMADGRRRIRINCRNLDGSDNTNITLGYTTGGIAYCSFPDTGRVDGQWVFKSTELANGVTWNSTSHSDAKDYSLSSYLPNDSQKYEVIIRANGTTTSTSGKFIRIGITSGIITTQAYACACRTRTASTQNCAGSIILPIGTDRKISVAGTTDASADGTYTLRALGYRRIGLNS